MIEVLNKLIEVLNISNENRKELVYEVVYYSITYRLTYYYYYYYCCWFKGANKCIIFHPRVTLMHRKNDGQSIKCNMKKFSFEQFFVGFNSI